MRVVKARIVKRQPETRLKLFVTGKGAPLSCINDRRNESEDQKSGLHRVCVVSLFEHTAGFVCVGKFWRREGRVGQTEEVFRSPRGLVQG
jgi:hypothetical protein